MTARSRHRVMTTKQCHYDTIIGKINNFEVTGMERQDRLEGE